MKPFFLSSLFFIAVYSAAYASPDSTMAYVYSNAISAHNISVIHHSLSDAVFGSFDYYGLHVGEIDSAAINSSDERSGESKQKYYGSYPSLYGTMPMYGEWNDDGNAYVIGRAGGDLTRKAGLNIWARYVHSNEREKFKDFKELDTKYNLILAGLGTTGARLGSGALRTGVFAGYAGGDQKNKYTEIEQRGGYIGVYGSYHIWRMQAMAVATMGKIDSDVGRRFGGADFDNAWLGADARVAYDILLDSDTTLQPSVRLSYMHVFSSNFTALGHMPVKNDDFDFFEITPGLRMLADLKDGWFGAISAKYALRFQDGGNAHVYNGVTDLGGGMTDLARIKLHDLEAKDYVEYGIGVEKHFGLLNVAFDINRRDGGRTGWIGGAHIKYIF